MFLWWYINHVFIQSTSRAEIIMRTKSCLSIKMPSYQYRDPYVKDKTVSWRSYLKHGNPYTWETQSVQWVGALVSTKTIRFNYCWTSIIEVTDKFIVWDKWPESIFPLLSFPRSRDWMDEARDCVHRAWRCRGRCLTTCEWWKPKKPKHNILTSHFNLLQSKTKI